MGIITLAGYELDVVKIFFISVLSKYQCQLLLTTRLQKVQELNRVMCDSHGIMCCADNSMGEYLCRSFKTPVPSSWEHTSVALRKPLASLANSTTYIYTVIA